MQSLCCHGNDSSSACLRCRSVVIGQVNNRQSKNGVTTAFNAPLLSRRLRPPTYSRYWPFALTNEIGSCKCSLTTSQEALCSEWENYQSSNTTNSQTFNEHQNPMQCCDETEQTHSAVVVIPKRHIVSTSTKYEAERHCVKS
jgi:hypothetical protein